MWTLLDAPMSLREIINTHGGKLMNGLLVFPVTGLAGLLWHGRRTLQGLETNVATSMKGSGDTVLLPEPGSTVAFR